MEEILLADLSLPPHGEAIIYLLNEHSKDEMAGGTELSVFVKNNLVSELKKRQGVYIILAFVDGNPAGLVNCFEGFSTFACKPLLNIHDVFVIADYRGRGISKKMLNKAEEIAISLGCCKLTLEILEGNTIAKMAYTSCGYSVYELNPQMGGAMFWQKKLID